MEPLAQTVSTLGSSGARCIYPRHWDCDRFPVVPSAYILPEGQARGQPGGPGPSEIVARVGQRPGGKGSSVVSRSQLRSGERFTNEACAGVGVGVSVGVGEGVGASVGLDVGVNVVRPVEVKVGPRASGEVVEVGNDADVMTWRKSSHAGAQCQTPKGIVRSRD